MPPIRSEQDRQALIAGLNDGTIDCIASHHRPHEWDAKAKEFEYASDGMNVQEMSFAITNNAINDIVPLERIIDSLANRANDIFGLKKEGIKDGAKADFTLFCPTTTSSNSTLQSKSRNNPFLGKTLTGTVIGIIKDEALFINNKN
jgi:dihydroorotase